MKLCCVFNYPSHYRYPIYKAIADNFNSDWFFGNDVGEPIKMFDVNLLNNFSGFITPHWLRILPFKRFTGCKGILNKRYSHYLLTSDWTMLINWRIIIYAKLTGKKVYTWGHGAYDYTKKLHTRIVERLFYSSLDGVFLYNEYSSKFIEAAGVKREKIHYIHNSLDTKLQTEMYEKSRLSEIYSEHFGNNNPVVIYIGRIQKRKKLDQLVEAIALLKSQGKLVNCVVVGGKTDENEIEELVKDKNLLDQFWFYGPSYDEKTNAELLYNADVCVSPGNVGLTCMHSLSYGCPVVSHDNFHQQMPEFEAVVPGKTGSFFKQDDIEDLAKHIQFWSSLSPEARQECRELARKTIVEQWSVDYQIQLLKDVIK